MINLQKPSITEILNRLPIAVDQLPVKLIVKFGTPLNPGGGREFHVRRTVVQQWLLHLKQHNPNYSDITIDDEKHNALPNDGTVIDQVERLAEMPRGHTATTATTTTTTVSGLMDAPVSTQ